MNKKIIFALITFVHLVNSMDQQNIFTDIAADKDLLWALTERLCIGNNQATNEHQFFKGKKELFHSLLLLNKTFWDYYSNENIQQRIIDKFAQQKDFSTLVIAKCLCCHKIKKKIIDLHAKVSNKDMMFSEEYLAKNNSWYLNSTVDGKNYLFDHHKCLLTTIIDSVEVKVEKAEILINNTAFSCSTLPLQCVIKIRNFIKNGVIATKARIKNDKIIANLLKHEQTITNLFDIFTLLLTRFPPDHRYSIDNYTALMLAAKINEKEVAQLLLEHGANPFLLYCPFSDSTYSMNDTFDHTEKVQKVLYLKNAFTCEKGEPKGWLMKMYNEIQKKESNYDTQS